MTIIHKESLNQRAEKLESIFLNGIKLLLVKDLIPAAVPPQAVFEIYFFNSNEITNFITNDPLVAQSLFTISGGHRIFGGSETEEIKVIKIQGNPLDNTGLILTVSPIGDYSTYYLNLKHSKIDPLFSRINFKFRPGCFNIDCAPSWESAPAPKLEPSIDYLAKDYDSFKHTLINAMKIRVPEWQATSEADLDQVLIDLFSAAADELSDFQDRVMNEAYLGSTRKRVSLARHARLMDYHIHQGNQASTWLALELGSGTDFTLAKGFQVWAGSQMKDNKSIFISKEESYLHHLLNRIQLYMWDDAVPALKAGSNSADLKIADGSETTTKTVQDLIQQNKINHLLIQEEYDPQTGNKAGANPSKRQVLRLRPGEEGAKALQDPVTSKWYLRTSWKEEDKLQHNYCFQVKCPGKTIDNISFFCGNLVKVYHGLPVEVIFKDPSEYLGNQNEYHYERMEAEKAGTICILPEEPLAYKETKYGGEIPPESTVEIEVESGGAKDPWNEEISLIHSDSSDEKGDHFVVETDEEGNSIIRFGNGINGKKLPEDSVVFCKYQVGNGIEGNIGSDTLINFNKNTFADIVNIWNPFDITNGRSPELQEEIIRRVPEAFRSRQLRAVTLKDYENRAQELAEVSNASAKYAWTGSWRTVRITIDPKGTSLFSDVLREKIKNHLEAVRLIGEDIEIRPPRFVPVEIKLSICIHPRYWPEDFRYILEQEFSDGYLPDGRMAFFHPDKWTFGQSLRASQIFGQIQSIEGVDHITSITMQRWNQPTTKTSEVIEVRSNEIIQVKNDPDHMEKGSITFFIKGGRR